MLDALRRHWRACLVILSSSALLLLAARAGIAAKIFETTPIQIENIFKNRDRWGIINFNISKVGDLEQVDIEIESVPWNVTTRNRKQRTYSEIHVYVFSSNSECEKDGLQGDVRCFLEIPITELVDAGHNRTAHHMSMITGTFDKHNRPIEHKTSTRLMLSKGSVPPLVSGEWHALITCGLSLRGRDEDLTCRKTNVKLTTTRIEHFRYRIIWEGGGIAFLGTALLFYGTHIFHTCLRPRTDHMHEVFNGLPSGLRWPSGFIHNEQWWVECRRSLKSMFSFENRWKAMFLTVGLVFSAYAGQLAIGESHIMQQTGDHDVCRFNEKCFYPSLTFGDWLPINTILSHWAYVLSSFYVSSAVIWVNSTCPRDLYNKDEFGAIGLVIFLEALGSSFYHICPSLRTFQFDTAFMTPLAHLFTMVMFKVQPTHSLLSKKKRGSKRCPMLYLTTVLAPLWLFNSIGSWFDMKTERGPLFYPVFLFFMFWWNWYVFKLISAEDWTTYKLFRGSTASGVSGCLNYFRQAFPVLEHALAISLAILSAIICSRYHEGFVQSPEVGGTANLNLYSACLTMLIVALRPWLRNTRIRCCNIRMDSSNLLDCGSFHCQICCIAVPYFFSFAIGFVGMVLFITQKVNNLENEPSVSRTKNQNCIPFTLFDVHDLWHILSALLLGEAARLLIAINVFNQWFLEEINITVKPQAVCTFKGEMGIACNDDGIVQKVIAGRPAHTKGILEGDQIFRIEATYKVNKWMEIDCDDDGNVKVANKAANLIKNMTRKRGKIVEVGNVPFEKKKFEEENDRGYDYVVKVRLEVSARQFPSRMASSETRLHLTNAEHSGSNYKVWVRRADFEVAARPDGTISDLKELIAEAKRNYPAAHQTLDSIDPRPGHGRDQKLRDTDAITPSTKFDLSLDMDAINSFEELTDARGKATEDRKRVVGLEQELVEASSQKYSQERQLQEYRGKIIELEGQIADQLQCKELDPDLTDEPLGLPPRKLSYILRQLFVKLDIDCYGSLHYYEMNAMLQWLLHKGKDGVVEDLRGYFLAANKDGNDALERTEWECYIKKELNDDEAKIEEFKNIVHILDPYEVRQTALRLMKKPPASGSGSGGLPPNWQVVRSTSRPGQFEYKNVDGTRQAKYENILNSGQPQ